MSNDQDNQSPMPANHPSGWEDFKRFFLRGLAALLPALLTIGVVVWAYHVLDEYVGRYITHGLIHICAHTMGEPKLFNPDDALTYGTPIDEWRTRDGRRLTVEHKIISYNMLHIEEEEAHKRAEMARNRAMWQIVFSKYKLNLIGFLIAIIFVYFMGFFLASLIGRTIWRMAERALHRIPVVGAIYPNFKQVTDFLLSERKLEFSGVVAVEYPRKGLWSVGLRTGPPMRSIATTAGKELVTVFIPSSPTPITGYVITVPVEDTIDLGLSIDEALRFTISAGVIKPPQEGMGENDDRLLPDKK
ncbi:MAG: DUF502 domain-containing protein [Phycisphaerae bacterium]|nr:DUF502 domain-containing protein [Phycisphaerae bacterium]